MRRKIIVSLLAATWAATASFAQNNWPNTVSLGPILPNGAVERTLEIPVPLEARGAEFRATVEPPFLRVNPASGTLGAILRLAVTGGPLFEREAVLTLDIVRFGFSRTSISIGMVPDGFAKGGGGETKPPPPPPPPPPAPRDPKWNAWVEGGLGPAITWNPESRLGTSTNYAVALELALSEYVSADATSATAPIGDVLGKIISQLPPAERQLQLQALLLADSRYISAPTQFRPFVIDVAGLREAAKGKVYAPAKVTFAQMKAGGFSNLRLGHVLLPFRSTGVAGSTSLAVSIWHKDVPVGEVVVGPFCVARTSTEACQLVPTPAATLSGLDSTLSPAINRQRLGTPLASLQLIQVAPHQTFGVLARSGSQTYTSWSLPRSLSDIAALIRTSVNDTLEQAIKDGDSSFLEEGGRAIANAILEGIQSNDGPPASALLTQLMQAAAQATGPPPALYVRAVAEGRSPLFGIPLALASLPFPDEEKRDFLGFHLRIETPLEGVTYQPSEACINRWVVLVPPDDPRQDEALKAARREVLSWLSRMQSQSSRVTVYDSIATFAEWARRQSQADTESTAIIVISHHDGGRLYFSPAATLPATNIQRRLLRPGAVILSACGSAGLGSTDVLRQFVESGVNAVVGTSMEVDGGMAGKFVSMLLEDLSSNAGDPSYSIGRAIFATTKRLSKETFDGKVPYGAFALLFGLAGDGGLQLCVPR